MWFGRSTEPVSFTLTNSDSREISESRVCVVRADLMPVDTMAGEPDSVLWSAGENIIKSGWVQARISGGTWQAIDDWTNGLQLGAILPAESVVFEIKLSIPDEMPQQGKLSFALMIAAK
jgi:hypothetical protein